MHRRAFVCQPPSPARPGPKGLKARRAVAKKSCVFTLSQMSWRYVSETNMQEIILGGRAPRPEFRFDAPQRPTREVC